MSFLFINDLCLNDSDQLGYFPKGNSNPNLIADSFLLMCLYMLMELNVRVGIFAVLLYKYPFLIDHIIEKNYRINIHYDYEPNELNKIDPYVKFFLEKRCGQQRPNSLIRRGSVSRMPDTDYSYITYTPFSSEYQFYVINPYNSPYMSEFSKGLLDSKDRGYKFYLNKANDVDNLFTVVSQLFAYSTVNSPQLNRTSTGMTITNPYRFINLTTNIHHDNYQ